MVSLSTQTEVAIFLRNIEDIVMDWSATQTEKYNYLNEVKEEYAEEKAFVNNSIEAEII